MKNFTITLFLALLGGGMWAQSAKLCGTDFSAVDDSIYVATVDQMKMDTSNPVIQAPRYIPVYFHIIRQSDGAGGIDPGMIDAALDAMNQQEYDTIDFHFFRCAEPNFIDDDSYFDQVAQGSSQETDLVNGFARPSLINIYFAPVLIDDNGTDTICGFSRLPWQGGNYLFMQNNCVADGSSLSHQLGHYFGLSHTHHSSATIAREHVTRVETDSCFNCETAGDLLCDTPADPGLSLSTVDGSCNYNGAVKDTCSLSVISDYAPDVANLMSFSRKDCRNIFSEGQLERMLDFYQATRLTQLDPLMCANSPCYEDVTLPLDTAVAVDVKTVRASNSITSTETIDVQTSPGVTYKAGGFVCLNPGFRTTDGSVFSAFIEACQNFAPGGNDEEFLKVPEGKPGILIAPNPSAGMVTFWFKIPKQGETRVTVFNSNGQAMAVVADGFYDEGLHSVQWDGGHLKVGMYFVMVEHNGKRAVQKMAKMEH